MDTNALIWFANGDWMLPSALAAIAAAQDANKMFVSPISAWEAALAIRKRTNRPDPGGRDAAEWFQTILELPGVKLASVTRRIALEAARIPQIYGSGDPGDCFLIATARIKKVPIVTRDAPMIALAEVNQRYLRAIACW